MLKKIRIFAAFINITAALLIFLDFTGTLHSWLGWIAKTQLIPSILAVNFAIFGILVVVTLVFGRVYCSVICPLGMFQDLISWFSKKTKKNKFKYSPAISWLRYTILGIFIIALIAGISPVVSLLDPYSSFGRIISNLFAPLYKWGNNLLAYFAEKMNSYAFYSVDVWIKSTITFIVSIATFIIIGFLSWKNGRIYCNSICPVGTFLGFISRFSFFKPVINTTDCTNCGLCMRNCKSSCIDFKNHSIDYSRCVVCMDCLEICSSSAIKYLPLNKVKELNTAPEAANLYEDVPKDITRRKFISAISLLTIATAFTPPKEAVHGGLAVIEEKKVPKRKNTVLPPGAKSLRNFLSKCTACGLCVSACLNDILIPSKKLSTFMQPELFYNKGYCRPECVKCSEVCPTGAISLITKEEKSSTKIGTAVWIKHNCVVLRDDVSCSNCAEHCPVGAITMISTNLKDSEARLIPSVNEERCIGCGACENLCPARPFSAIYVEGIENHRLI